MKLGTLSMELAGSEMRLPGPERARIIAEAIEARRPDLLICGGYAVETDDDLELIRATASKVGWHGAAVVEVKLDAELVRDGNPADRLLRTGETPSRHRLYLVTASEAPRRLGPQLFSTSGQLGRRDGPEFVRRFEDHVEEKSAHVLGKHLAVLCCGELNIARGRSKEQRLSYGSKRIEEWLHRADIIVNPTHDRMGNGGILDAKRHNLSAPEGDRPRCYVSVSNWNVGPDTGEWRKPRQYPEAVTLHTVYVNGVMRHQSRMPGPDYEYREIEIPEFAA